MMPNPEYGGEKMMATSTFEDAIKENAYACVDWAVGSKLWEGMQKLGKQLRFAESLRISSSFQASSVPGGCGMSTHGRFIMKRGVNAVHSR